MRDLYRVLGVSRDASPADIKKAFRKLARTYHPDVAEGADAEKRFKEVNAAYEVLGDEQRRSLYDEFGEASLQQGFDPDRARAFGGMGGTGGFGGMGGMGGMGGGLSLDELLGSLFGGGGARRGAPRPAGPRKGADLRTELRVPFMDALRGEGQTITLRRPGACAPCGGVGGTGKAPCSGCGGSGRVPLSRGAMNMMVGCSTCGGGGVTFAAECGSCGGTGRTQSPAQLRINLPAGIDDGQTIRLRGQGAEGSRGGPPGDLLVTVRVASHPFLTRDGDDLSMDLPLTVLEAMAGAKVEAPTPWGSVKLTVPAGARSGQRLRLRGRGVRKKETKGDLFVVLRPAAPATDDEAALEAARALEEHYGAGVRENLALD